MDVCAVVLADNTPTAPCGESNLRPNSRVHPWWCWQATHLPYLQKKGTVGAHASLVTDSCSWVFPRVPAGPGVGTDPGWSLGHSALTPWLTSTPAAVARTPTLVLADETAFEAPRSAPLKSGARASFPKHWHQLCRCNLDSHDPRPFWSAAAVPATTTPRYDCSRSLPRSDFVCFR